MNLADKVSIPAQVLARDIGGEAVILDLESGVYFGLDPVGTRIWQLLGERKSLAETCEAMLAEYDVARADIERDVLALVEKLQARRLVEIV